jgi:membrane protein DedA with SNARE-associated domain
MGHHLILFIGHIKYLGIILLLLFGSPVPDEVLLSYVGYNVYLGKMSYFLSIICAIVGIISAISLSYCIGFFLGLPFLTKFGPKIGITRSKLIKARYSFRRFGPPLILVSYFFPGFMHLIAYVAGINKYSFRKFMLYAYSGGILWSILFISLGKILGKDILKIHRFHNELYFIGFVLAVVVLIIWYLKRKKAKSTHS